MEGIFSTWVDREGYWDDLYLFLETKVKFLLSSAAEQSFQLLFITVWTQHFTFYFLWSISYVLNNYFSHHLLFWSISYLQPRLQIMASLCVCVLIPGSQKGWVEATLLHVHEQENMLHDCLCVSVCVWTHDRHSVPIHSSYKVRVSLCVCVCVCMCEFLKRVRCK